MTFSYDAVDISRHVSSVPTAKDQDDFLRDFANGPVTDDPFECPYCGDDLRDHAEPCRGDGA